MLVEASDHLVALRDPPVNGEHRHVCLQRLLQLLRDTTGFDPKTKTGTNKTKGKNITKSKKRSHDEDGSSDDGSLRKRAKVLSGNAIKVTADERLLPVYQRVLRLRYSTSPDVPNLYPFDYVDDERAADLGWINVEQTLREWVSNYVASKGDTSPIPLGPVSVDSLVHGVYEAESGSVWPLLSLPHIRDSFDPKEYDLFSGQRIRNLHNLLQAFRLLEDDGRTRITSTISVVPSSDHAPNEMPFFLQIHVNCSLVCPKIFDPVMPAGKAMAESTRVLEVQEAQRLLILQLFPPATPVPDSYHATADIPFLFSILGPAPALPSSAALDALQPDALLPTLLPFQRRSVGWMIGREGKAITASGDIVSSAEVNVDERPLPLFWHRHSVSADETWYVNRLRGIISPTRPTAEDDDLEEEASGGIVAEEPGLGKTLECISTIMLNPAPDRSPVNTRWDPEAKLDVKEIKVSTVVECSFRKVYSLSAVFRLLSSSPRPRLRRSGQTNWRSTRRASRSLSTKAGGKFPCLFLNATCPSNGRSAELHLSLRSTRKLDVHRKQTASHLKVRARLARRTTMRWTSTRTRKDQHQRTKATRRSSTGALT